MATANNHGNLPEVSNLPDIELYQNPSDVLSKGVSLINRMKKTASTFRADDTKPDIAADMIFAYP